MRPDAKPRTVRHAPSARLPSEGHANRELLVVEYLRVREAQGPASRQAHALRGRLLLAFAREVRVLARSAARNMPGSVIDVDDLLQDGALHLLGILETYDPLRAPFVQWLRFTLKRANCDTWRRETHRALEHTGERTQLARIDGAALHGYGSAANGTEP